jgi:hypothetical protein
LVEACGISISLQIQVLLGALVDLKQTQTTSPMFVWDFYSILSIKILN